eukprot:TRINITY_DN4393_c0_g1_i4.p1 TRINITY_DN4393_c0_g1~~TRINITY_DN4393_c0_g1_i4.p1  ORF type:complete len:532 (+),score=166.90 TRINITY_DN4393_c0_g1_i4:54-1649(+)
MGVDKELVDQFVAITGSDKNLASSLLEACNGNLEMAINMHMENECSGGSGQATPPVGAAASGASGSSGAAARGATSESNGFDDDDNVRAPIPQKQETLVEFGYEGYEMPNRRQSRVRVRSVFDGFRNFEEETRRMEEGGGGPGAGGARGRVDPPGYSRSKKRTLEDLFKPPLDIMFQGDWQSARDRASTSGRWLLVNIQDPKEFQCQVLNRDLWSNDGVKSIVSEHFIFWQQYRESDEAQRYMMFYKITNWPYISVIDPRTGENLVTWSKIDANSFPEIITEFLSLHPTLETPEKEPPRKRLKPNMDSDSGGGAGSSANLAELDEDAQIAAAIKASLEHAVAGDSQNDSKEDNLELSGGYEDDDEVSKDSFSEAFQPLDNKSSNSSKDKGSETSRGEKSKLESRVSPPATTAGSSQDSTDGGGKGGKVNGKDVSGEGEEEDGWKQYLGTEDTDSLTNILIRYPDGEKDPWKYPVSSKLKALTEYISAKGYPSEVYEVVTNFPRKVITSLDLYTTLKDLNLARETMFVQLKD